MKSVQSIVNKFKNQLKEVQDKEQMNDIWQPPPLFVLSTQNIFEVARNSSLGPNDILVTFSPYKNLVEKTNYTINIFLNYDGKENALYSMPGNEESSFVLTLNVPTNTFRETTFIKIEAKCKCLFEEKIKLSEVWDLKEFLTNSKISKEFHTFQDRHGFKVNMKR